MFGKRLGARLRELLTSNHKAPHRCMRWVGGDALSHVRALATGAALVTSIDMTLVAVVSIYANARRDGGRARRAS